MLCRDCDAKLTVEEAEYYEDRCEGCERDHHAALTYYR